MKKISSALYNNTASLEDWQQVIDTNLTGTWLLTQRVSQFMIEETTEGAIINVSSIAGTRSHMQGYLAYGASKAAINHLKRVLACELGQWNIRINTLVPGGIVTNESVWQEKVFA